MPIGRWRQGWLTRSMTNRLDIVTVGIKNKSAVIVRVVMRTQAGRSVVGAASGQCRAMECIDCHAIRRDQCDMYPPAALLTGSDPELRAPGRPEPGAFVASGLLAGDIHDRAIAERRERRDVERAAARKIGDGQSDVIEH